MNNPFTKIIGFVSVIAIAYSVGIFTSFGSLMTTTAWNSWYGYGYWYDYAANVTVTEAFDRAVSQGIVKNVPQSQANLDKEITRLQAAKVITNYAKKVKWVIITSRSECKVSDYNDANLIPAGEVQYVKAVCDMGIMGVNPDGTMKDTFMSSKTLTRGEFATMLSRHLYGSANEATNNEAFYKKHLAALKTNGIITNDKASMTELRGWVLIMFKRLSMKN